jgi:fatty acid desaturase
MTNWRDWQSVGYLLGLPFLVLWCWNQRTFPVIPYAVLLTLVIGICCVSHNHAHVPIWRTAWPNRLTDLWIGVLQGQPVFLFLPAHIGSHHRYNQGEHDITRVTRYAQHNHFIGYLVFPFQVLPALGALRKRYLSALWEKDRRQVGWIAVLYLPVVALWTVALAVDPLKAVLFVLVPQVIGLHFLLASNYLQHAHALGESRYNHSRNFHGWINVIWFNVGYHTAHHEDETLHWTHLPAAHRAIVKKVRPELNEKSLFVYVVKTLCGGLVRERWRSKQIVE